MTDLNSIDLPRFTTLMAEVDRQLAEHFPIKGVNQLPRLVDRCLEWHYEENGGDDDNEQFLHPDHEPTGNKWILSSCTKHVTELLTDAGVNIDEEDPQGLEEYVSYIEQLAEHMSTI
jgi:hypothetical protein